MRPPTQIEMLAVTAEERRGGSPTPLIAFEITPNGTGDAVAALFSAHWLAERRCRRRAGQGSLLDFRRARSHQRDGRARTSARGGAGRAGRAAAPLHGRKAIADAMTVPGFAFNPIMLAIEGAVIGFLIAVPVGPAAALCIRRSITVGAVAGYMTGVGAALGDAVFGAVAAFGLSLRRAVRGTPRGLAARHRRAGAGRSWAGRRCATGRARSAIRWPTTASTASPRICTTRARASSSPYSTR